MGQYIEKILPSSGEIKHWFYEKAYQSSIHPLVKLFLGLNHERIARRYCHTHPLVQEKDILRLLAYKCEHFFLAGTDLMYVTNEINKRSMIVIENNSCPSGQKSMPLFSDSSEHGGYEAYTNEVLVNQFTTKTNKKDGVLAVIYDKNEVETRGFAHTLSDLMNEDIYFVYMAGNDKHIRLQGGWIEISIGNKWKRVRGCMRYVTQKPRKKIPIICKTLVLNPIITCLSGGRNKLIAAKAYESYNNRLRHVGLQIAFPETIYDVPKANIASWIERWGGYGVIKNPYSNAGQGVYTITNKTELEKFLSIDHEYNSFIVQSLIGNHAWSSHSKRGKHYHVGMLPNKKGKIFVFDLRMRIMNTSNGFKPLSMNARRANLPLPEKISKGDSWEYLGTNLSIRNEDGSRGSDTSRLLLADVKDFTQLGVGIDDLIEGYIQSVLSTIAIDRMAKSLIAKDGTFRMKHFKTLNNDDQLLSELFGH